MIGAYWKQAVEKGANALSLSVNYVAQNGSDSDSSTGGFLASNAKGNMLAQLGYAGPQWGVALGYRYGQCGTGFRRGTEFAKPASWSNGCGGTNSASNSFALNAYWQPEEAGWIPSISAGWGLNVVPGEAPRDGFDSIGRVRGSQSWMVGLKWADAFQEGNALGFAVGQPTFATSVSRCDFDAVNGASCSDTAFDGNYLFELYYNIQLTDNIAIAPAVFYLSRPLGQQTRNLVSDGMGYDGQFNVFGCLVQTTFRF